ncbi:hypothetical protein BP5796_09070 [Coleophoma crateriformis]|uniref:Amidohydrolase-related domain-containing protein n=1 Tax=Coleophoma crateriformis TaxID=565419 RepID=A0A3D8R2Z0_9HELO|nr:hypothetical protein BP5796_09070 [Coleophoma crateriformis]
MMRRQLRWGASVIKICPRGVTVISDEAKRAGRGVAAHAHAKAGVMAALEMDSCLTIEHGTYIDEEAADPMKRKGVLLVAARFIIETRMQNLDHLPPAIRAKMVQFSEADKQTYALCVQNGVKIALGTDICSCDPSRIASAGKSGMEIGYAVAAGLSPLKAIEAATANGPETLGPQAPLSGQIYKSRLDTRAT